MISQIRFKGGSSVAQAAGKARALSSHSRRSAPGGNQRLGARLLVIMAALLLAATQVHAAPPEYVVLLHGLARTSGSIKHLEAFLSEQGYQVLNLDYPSRKYRIPELAAMVREEVVSQTPDARRVHFVTHSMGGIVLRYLQGHDPLPNLGRVVMLSPPNHGSEVVDALGPSGVLDLVNGPACRQLCTGEGSLCNSLGLVDFELGVITGDRSINLINSLIIPGKDDGKVSVESARVGGMADFMVVHATHPFIMKDKDVMTGCLRFLRTGSFHADRRDRPRSPAPR